MERTPPATGDLDGAAPASARTIDPAQWTSDEPVLGLVREAGYVWGTLRDDAGELFSVMRRIPPRLDHGGPAGGEHRSLGDRLVVLATCGPAGESWDALRVRREPKDAAQSAEIVRSPRPDGARFAAPAGARRGMRLDLGTEAFAYREDAVLDLEGRRTCPALQWYVPGADAAMLYLTQTWEVAGELLGRRVHGFLFWEEAYMYPGARLYVTHDALLAAGYYTWYSAATRYDDGSSEVVHAVLGTGALGVFVTSSSTGEVTVGRRVDARVALAPGGGWHAGIDYDVDGVGWRCEPDPRGRMELGPMPNPQQEGRIARVDDQRVPVAHMAWGEIVPARVAR